MRSVTQATASSSMTASSSASAAPRHGRHTASTKGTGGPQPPPTTSRRTAALTLLAAALALAHPGDASAAARCPGKRGYALRQCLRDDRKQRGLEASAVSRRPLPPPPPSGSASAAHSPPPLRSRAGGAPCERGRHGLSLATVPPLVPAKPIFPYPHTRHSGGPPRRLRENSAARAAWNPGIYSTGHRVPFFAGRAPGRTGRAGRG